MPLACSSALAGAVNPYESPVVANDPSIVPADLAIGAAGWTIEYELTPEDLMEWSLHSQCTSAAQRKNSRGLTVAGMMAVLVPLAWICILLRHASLSGLQAAAMGVAICASLLGSWCGFLKMYYRAIQSSELDFHRQPANAHLIGPRRLQLLPDGARISTPVAETAVRWAGITRIDCGPEVLYLCISDVSALIVPKRAFADDELFRQFVKAAVEFYERAVGIRDSASDRAVDRALSRKAIP